MKSIRTKVFKVFLQFCIVLFHAIIDCDGRMDRYADPNRRADRRSSLSAFGNYNPNIPIRLGTSRETELEIVTELIIWGSVPEIMGIALSVNDNSVEGKRQRQKQIRYLVKNKTQNKWIAVKRDGSNIEDIIKWNNSGKVKVVIHGFCPKTWNSPEENLESNRVFEIGDAYHSVVNDLNVVIVDWTPLAMEAVYRYYEAADSTSYAGEDVAEFLVKLKHLGLISDWKDVHLVGFSLGAHVAAVAGAVVQKLVGSKVGRITGIDPAGPLFEEDGELIKNRTKVLDPEDATFVDVIHCNMGSIYSSVGGRLGTIVQCGHADFYPDGGRSQNSCSFFGDRTSACSHSICPHYFANSISKSLFSCSCPSWSEFINGDCPCIGEKKASMGEKCEPSLYDSLNQCKRKVLQINVKNQHFRVQKSGLIDYGQYYSVSDAKWSSFKNAVK